MSFKYKGKGFEGVVNYLKKIDQLDNIINVNVSSVFDGFDANSIFHDDEYFSHWVSEDGENEFVIFTFNFVKPILTHYTIRSHSQDQFYLRSWTFSGSNNLSDWIELHSNSHSTDLQNLQAKTYKINNNMKKPFRYYRIKKTGSNEIEDERMRVWDVEFFGSFINLPTCFISKHFIIKKLFVMILFLL